MLVSVDDSAFPIVFYRWPKETTDEEIAKFLDHQKAVLVRCMRHVVILDMRYFATNTAKQRRMAADWLKDNEADLRHYRLGCVIIAPNAAAASTMRSVYWQTPPPYPWEIVEAGPAAVLWAIEQLFKEGMPRPARVPHIP